jgi:hypothetical protein
VAKPGQVLVQFEEHHLQEARGWWQFAAADFGSPSDSYALT